MCIYLKECNSGRARWQRCTGKLCGKGQECPPPLRMLLFPSLHEFTNPEALKNLFLRVLMEVSVHNHDWVNHWPLLATDLQSLTFWRLGGGWDVRPSNQRLGPASILGWCCCLVSDSLRPHGPQHTRLLCPPLSISKSLLRFTSLVWLSATPWTTAHQAPLSSAIYLPEFAQIHVPRVGETI